jgi:hypothetical protein
VSSTFNVYAGPAVRVPVKNAALARDFCENVLKETLWCCAPEGDSEYVFLLPNRTDLYPEGWVWSRDRNPQSVTLAQDNDESSYEWDLGEDCRFFWDRLNREKTAYDVPDFLRQMGAEPVWVILPYYL